MRKLILMFGVLSLLLMGCTSPGPFYDKIYPSGEKCVMMLEQIGGCFTGCQFAEQEITNFNASSEIILQDFYSWCIYNCENKYSIEFDDDGAIADCEYNPANLEGKSFESDAFEN